MTDDTITVDLLTIKMREMLARGLGIAPVDDISLLSDRRTFGIRVTGRFGQLSWMCHGKK
jgi:hypothetical protein